MARCELRIELEPGRDVWTLGGVVRGDVVVSTDGDVRCDGLDVRTMWATHGKGDPDRGAEHRQRLFEGQWPPGTHRLPFELLLPSQGPAAYRGHLVNVGWFVRADADIPWAADPSAEVEITVRPAPGIEPDWKAQFESEDSVPLPAEHGGRERKKREVPLVREPGEESPPGEKLLQAIWSIGCLGIIGFLLFQAWIFVSTLVTGLDAAVHGGGPWIPVVLQMGFVALVVIGIAGVATFVARQIARKRRLGPVEVEVEPRRVAPGEVVRVTVKGRPRVALQLNRAWVRLHGRERAVRGSGTRQKHFEHTLRDEAVEMEGLLSLAAGRPLQLTAEIAIPPSAPPSFATSSNAVRWTVEPILDIASCPNWSKRQSLVVTVPRELDSAGPS